MDLLPSAIPPWEAGVRPPERPALARACRTLRVGLRCVTRQAGPGGSDISARIAAMKASISAASTSHAASARPAIERAKGLLPPRPRLEDGDRALLVDASRRRCGVIDPGGLRARGLGTQQLSHRRRLVQLLGHSLRS